MQYSIDCIVLIKNEDYFNGCLRFLMKARDNEFRIAKIEEDREETVRCGLYCLVSATQLSSVPGHALLLCYVQYHCIVFFVKHSILPNSEILRGKILSTPNKIL